MKNIVFGALLFGCIYAIVFFVGKRRQARNDIVECKKSDTTGRLG